MLTRLLKLSKTNLVYFAAFILLVAVMPLSDPDYFWHLKTGEYIVAHGALPAGDVFSFTRAGQAWVLHEWLFEVLLHLVFASAGDTGAKALVVMLGLAALGLVFGMAKRLSASDGLAWIPVLIAAPVLISSLAPRPQMLTYLCFALYLGALLAFKYAGKIRPLFALPLVMVVWVNGHAGYAIGIALLVLFAVCEWLGWLAQPVRDPAHKRRLLRLTQAACLVVLASLANPGMFERWLYPFQVLGMTVNAVIQEWQSPDFHWFPAKAYLALMLLLLIANVYAARKPDLTELALPLFFAFNGCIAVRHMPLAVLVLVPFTALALARSPFADIGARVRGSALVCWYMARRGIGRELGKGEFLLNWLMACVIALCLPVYVQGVRQEAKAAVPDVKIVGATDFIAARGLGGRLFNAYGDGGYLIYRLAPHARVAIDGRADLYGDRFIEDYMRVYGGADDWQSKFERFGAHLAVLPLDAPIRQLLLASAGFREVYRDKYYAVLQRDPPAQKAREAV